MRLPVASRRKFRAKDALAFETARLEMAVCLGDLIARDLLGDGSRMARFANRSKRSRFSRNQTRSRALIALIE
jgi:hypothetical protein